MKFLIVDDQPTCRLMLDMILKRLGHDTTLCADGLEAWEALTRERFDVVFADWVMPGLDGLELCRRIRSADHEHYIYFVLCTAKDTQKDLVTAMEAGADDFSTKPVRPDEIEVRVRAAQRICDLQAKLKAKNAELELKHRSLSEAYARIESDLTAAAKVLEDSLPGAHTDPRLEASFIFQPSHVLGGDFLNYFSLGENILGFYLLDVAGHGVPAALKASTLSRLIAPNDSLLWDESRTNPKKPHEVVRLLNQMFLDDEDYFTLLYGLFYIEENRLEFTQAGHPSPVLLRGGEARVVGGGGFPVSLLDTDDFVTETLELQSGDRFFFYSDGLTEAESSHEEQFGEARLLNTVSNCQSLDLEGILDSIKTELDAYRQGEPQDDVSVLGVQFGRE